MAMDTLKLWSEIRDIKFRSYPTDQLNVTGTQVDTKFAMDMFIQGSSTPIAVNSTIDLTDKISTFDLYSLNNLLEGDPMFVGMATIDGKWLIKKFTESTGAMTYANMSNNPTQITYDDAWDNKTILNFNKIHELTGV